MRSEFEKYFKENHADSFYSVDAALKMRGNDYIDFHAADLWALWQHQQSKIDELTKQRDSFIKAYEIEMNESVELQKRLDAAIYLLPSLKAENDLWGSDQVERQIELLEQALRGGQ